MFNGNAVLLTKKKKLYSSENPEKNISQVLKKYWATNCFQLW